jgi:hypothetical protein
VDKRRGRGHNEGGRVWTTREKRAGHRGMGQQIRANERHGQKTIKTRLFYNIYLFYPNILQLYLRIAVVVSHARHYGADSQTASSASFKKTFFKYGSLLELRRFGTPSSNRALTQSRAKFRRMHQGETAPNLKSI